MQGFLIPPGYVPDPNSPGYYYDPMGDPNDPNTWIQDPDFDPYGGGGSGAGYDPWSGYATPTPYSGYAGYDPWNDPNAYGGGMAPPASLTNLLPPSSNPWDPNSIYGNAGVSPGYRGGTGNPMTPVPNRPNMQTGQGDPNPLSSSPPGSYLPGQFPPGTTPHMGATPRSSRMARRARQPTASSQPRAGTGSSPRRPAAAGGCRLSSGLSTRPRSWRTRRRRSMSRISPTRSGWPTSG